jgi:hypothetical protein
MNREEAIGILDRFKSWNVGQKSIDHAFGGARTEEDDIYDARRKLIKTAMQFLNDDAEGSLKI